jgi:hypothetical protein
MVQEPYFCERCGRPYFAMLIDYPELCSLECAQAAHSAATSSKGNGWTEWPADTTLGSSVRRMA